MTDVKELTFRGEDKVLLYACGDCGLIYSPKVYAFEETKQHEAARKSAEDCCTKPKQTCSVCCVEVESYWTMCAMHREQKKLKGIATIPADDWDGPVQSDGVHGAWGEGYSGNVSELLEACHGYDDEVPAYCWPCKSDALRLDPEQILEHATEQHHEDAHEQIVDAEGFYSFIETWNDKQECVTWRPDHSRAVILDQARFDALINSPSAEG